MVSCLMTWTVCRCTPCARRARMTPVVFVEAIDMSWEISSFRLKLIILDTQEVFTLFISLVMAVVNHCGSHFALMRDMV